MLLFPLPRTGEKRKPVNEITFVSLNYRFHSFQFCFTWLLRPRFSHFVNIPDCSFPFFTGLFCIRTLPSSFKVKSFIYSRSFSKSLSLSLSLSLTHTHTRTRTHTHTHTHTHTFADSVCVSFSWSTSLCMHQDVKFVWYSTTGFNDMETFLLFFLLSLWIAINRFCHFCYAPQTIVRSLSLSLSAGLSFCRSVCLSLGIPLFISVARARSVGMKANTSK